MMAWNDTDIYEYLKVSCECVFNKYSFPKKWTKAQYCSVHYIKSLSDKIDDKDLSYEGKNFILDCIAFMIQCECIEVLDFVFKRMKLKFLTLYSQLLVEMKNCRLSKFWDLKEHKNLNCKNGRL